MALKSNFEDSNVISSPFVDEVANPGQGGVLGQIQRNVDTRAGLLDHSKPAPSSKISKADRDAKTTPAQKVAQARVNLADARHGDPKNKNRTKAEGR